jgi:hypothetical protein
MGQAPVVAGAVSDRAVYVREGVAETFFCELDAAE